MAKTAACPSCGAPVVFKSAASVFAVCEYCQSTLVRHDQALEDIGKMAALVEDRSPLQLGTEGSWQGLHFALIGRIQLKYSQGLWNEWHLLFDDMRTGWLSEAGGEYVLTFLHQVQEPLPAFAELQAGQRLVMASRPWTVTDIEQAECVAGQGELPFKVGAGYAAPVVDLRSGDNFASLDYSETPPLLFIGSPVSLKSLKLANLREGMAVPEINVQAQVFRCPSCGAPMSARSKEILAVGCAACGTVVDTGSTNYQILSKALGSRDEKYVPRIPLGSKGKLDGQAVEVIGFLVRETKADGIAYDWREYLLAGDGPDNRGTYRWLTEYNGHWNVADVLSRHPADAGLAGKLRYDNQEFKHFSTYRAEVIQVAGEFTWRVRRGETAEVADFVAPPTLLSRERTDNEITWSRGSYVEPTVIREAFKLAALPEPIGVYANQPSPWAETHARLCRLFWRLTLVAMAFQASFVFVGSSQSLLRQDLEFSPANQEETQATRTFELKRQGKLTVQNATNLDNNWVGLNMTLVDQKTGAAWPANREISYYHGYEDGESWSEGAQEDEVVFRDIPPGTYYLAVDPDLSQEKPGPVRTSLTVSRGGAGWSNYVLLMLFLAAFPIFSRLRMASFEVRRWAESDHPMVTSSDSDD